MTNADEASCPPPDLGGLMPPGLEGRHWHRNLVGESGGAVYRLSSPGEPDLFLKHGEGRVAAAIGDEAERMAWLQMHLPVPRVLHVARTSDGATLLMTALPGPTARQLVTGRPDSARATVDALAAILKRIHAVPAEACPFDGSAAARLVRAAAHVAAGEVDEDDFDEERRGWTAAEVLAAAEAMLPLPFERVVAHGDFSLDNIVMAPDGAVSGCLDLGRAGVADPYQDLAILWNGLRDIDPALGTRLFRSYGIAVPDAGRLRFHLLLDELF